MTLLKFDGPSRSPGNSKITSATKKPLKLILGIGALAGIITLGSTLAANIDLNTGAPIEFGQGVAQTTACDSSITITPFSTFYNRSGGGSFILSSITVSGIDSSSEHCAGKVFTLKAFGDSSSSELRLIYGGATSIEILDTGSDFIIDDTFGLSITTDGSTGFTLNFNSSAIASSYIFRITIESSDDSGVIASTYEVGDTGPGGGQIVYVALTPQPWGTYLEAAPTDVPTAMYDTLETGPNWDVSIPLAEAYRGNSLTDWRAPNTDELTILGNLAYQVLALDNLEWTWVHPLNDTWYWSSSCFEEPTNQACASGGSMTYLNPPTQNTLDYSPSGGARVRPVRTFGPHS